MKQLFNILRIGLAIGLLIWLLAKVNIRESLVSMRNANPFYLLLTIICFFLLILVSVWRWKVILDEKSLSFSLSYLLTVYFATWFFNNVLPTAIGGDVIRIIYTIKDNQKAQAFSATFVDRMIGFVGLFFFALLASAWLLVVQNQTRFLILNLVGFLILLVIIFILFNDRAHRFFSKIFQRIKVFRLGVFFDQLYDAIKDYRRKPKALLVSFLLSLLIQAILALSWFYTGYAVGIRIAVSYYFLYCPIIGLLTMIPITIGGLGIRENSFVTFFGQVGVNSVQATSTSLLYLIVNYGYALVGGIVFVFLKKSKEKKESYDFTYSPTKPGECKTL
ncbi:MAG: lysylphosphatidylglycerol synthase transmembrane domain-containing protein [candidate division WOR-3 bacterium]